MSGKRRPGGKLNALRHGLFAKDVVLASAGETQEEFDKLKTALWDEHTPQNATDVILVENLIEIAWQQRRVRACQFAMIRKQVAFAGERRQLEQLQAFKTLRGKFDSLRVQLQLDATLFPAERRDIVSSLAEIRRDLERNPLGVEFLIKNLQAAMDTVEVYGYLEPQLLQHLVEICGPETDWLSGFLQLNDLAKEDRLKVQPDTEQPAEQSANTASRAIPDNTSPEIEPAEVEKIKKRQILRDLRRAAEEDQEACQQLMEPMRALAEVQTNAGPNPNHIDVSAMRKALSEQCLRDRAIQEVISPLESAWKEEEKNNPLLDRFPHEYFMIEILRKGIWSLQLIKQQLQVLESIESDDALRLTLPREAQDILDRVTTSLQRRLDKTLDRIEKRREGR